MFNDYLIRYSKEVIKKHTIGDFVIIDGILEGYTGSGGDVVIPEGTTKIGEEVFSDNKKLVSIVIPEGVTEIKFRAFWGCDKLDHVVIPDSVTRIGRHCFAQCHNLGDIIFSKNLKNIGEHAFAGTAWIENQRKGLICAGSVLIDYTGDESDIFIPEGISSIGDSAFMSNENLINLSMSNDIYNIGKYAFYGCTNLATIELSDKLQYIGEYAFADCVNLSSIKIPDGVEKIEQNLFNKCASLKEVILPSSLKTICNRSFKGCVSLEKVLFSESVKTIQGDAFSECRKLRRMIIPDGIEEIGGAFEKCSELESLCIGEGLKELNEKVILYCPNLTELKLPNSLVSINKDALYDCQGITDLYLPASVTKLDGRAFETCFNVKNIIVSPENTKFCDIDGVVYSKDKSKIVLYPPGKDVQRYEIPEGVTNIGERAFSLDHPFFSETGSKLKEVLKEVVVPESITKISRTAICNHVELVRLPKSLNKISPKTIDSPYTSFWHAEIADKVKGKIYLGGPIDDLSPKCKSGAVDGFFYALKHNIEEIKKYQNSYITHIQNNSTTYCKLAAKDEFVLFWMLEHTRIPEKEVDTLLSLAEEQNKPEWKAALMEYKDNYYGATEESYSLEDTNPDIKRKLQMAERRAEIEGHKGIAGIVFVQSGDMAEFGQYNEYTGAKDMSDLKNYIESLGGFLRSAVSSKTDYIICNDPNSQSVKMQKARELEIPVISEEVLGPVDSDHS